MRWCEVEEAVPELAAKARGFFDAHAHKTIATLRADGSPRISGIEATFADGEVWLGSMANARKALDLRRDPRFALHSGSDDPKVWSGDAKLSGRAIELTGAELDAAFVAMTGEPPSDPGSHAFRLDIAELAVVSISEDRKHLVIESWTDGRGYRRIERD